MSKKQLDDSRVSIVRRPKSYRTHDLYIRVRRVRTNPAEKREEFLRRLDSAAKKIEAIVEDDNTNDKTKIMAANAIAGILRASYTIVRDIDIEDIEHEISLIEAEKQKLKEAEQVGIDFSPLEDTEEKRGP